jgi:hypothetical protein
MAFTAFFVIVFGDLVVVSVGICVPVVPFLAYSGGRRMESLNNDYTIIVDNNSRC